MAWIAPLFFSLALVYLHPLVALWFLDRELRHASPRWRKTYHVCLALIPICLVFIWISLARTPNLGDSGSLAWRITQHAGAGILTNVSSHLLVATHIFLETIHYGVWLVLIPLAGLKAPLWNTSRIPLASGRFGWPKSVRALLVMGICAVIVLWVAFSKNYGLTRDLYFTLAMAHVLAEAPFLIRML